MPHARTPFVGGNWKMNADLAAAVELADDVVAGCRDAATAVDIAVVPPFPYLQAVGRTLGHSGLLLGAQNLWPEPNGAFTGEVSAEMLVDLGVAAVIVGHSERRHIVGESDELVARKLRSALDASLWGILCVGETEAQRDSGETDKIVLGQLASALDDVEAEDLRQLVVAYEPVWAIGTGKTATPADAQAVHATIRAFLADRYHRDFSDQVRVIYGGSVNARNAAELFAQPAIDGGLIGGASLKAEEFAAISRAAAARAR
ncbi:MAG TPA: triose-phosphate isomerase [Phycisphaerales bacterium]|nr:triose-phosphate isomerase [Phycisphaerales bacterium]HMP37628.1 triose-phosphate isomerase [Phycisphaerales bacterium]